METPDIREPDPAPKRQYLVRTCEHSGCGVMIRYPVGTVTDQLCKWCQAGEARYCRTCGPQAVGVVQRVIVLPAALVGVLEAIIV